MAEAAPAACTACRQAAGEHQGLCAPCLALYRLGAVLQERALAWLRSTLAAALVALAQLAEFVLLGAEAAAAREEAERLHRRPSADSRSGGRSCSCSRSRDRRDSGPAAADAPQRRARGRRGSGKGKGKGKGAKASRRACAR